MACSTDTFTGPDGSSGDAAACTQSFCADAAATTCNDFDEDAQPQKWSTDEQVGTIGATQSTFTSCPSALQVVYPQIAAAPNEPHAYAIGQLGNPRDVTVTFDALLPQIPTASSGLVDGFVIFSLRETIDGGWSVRLERSPDQHWFVRLHQGLGGPVVNVGNADDLLLGAWNHMSLNVHYDTTSGSVSFTYQTAKGSSTLPLTGVATMAPGAVTQITSFAVGAAALSATSQQYTFLYDSILIQAN
jgi:hypothetical protein